MWDMSAFASLGFLVLAMRFVAASAGSTANGRYLFPWQSRNVVAAVFRVNFLVRGCQQYGHMRKRRAGSDEDPGRDWYAGKK